MKKRSIYAAAALSLLILEILIALYVRDAFIRPYGGDILVTVLLCCLCRAAVLDRIPYLPFWVFLFALAIELAQAAGMTVRTLINRKSAPWTFTIGELRDIANVWELTVNDLMSELRISA